MDGEVVRGLVGFANEVHERLHGLSEQEAMTAIKRIVDGSEVVFGVWQDPGEPFGVGVCLIKGERELAKLEAVGLPSVVSVAAIPCSGKDQAAAARVVFGDRLN